MAWKSLAALREWSKVPVIILSVREQEVDKIAALDAGADDYFNQTLRDGRIISQDQDGYATPNDRKFRTSVKRWLFIH